VVRVVKFTVTLCVRCGVRRPPADIPSARGKRGRFFDPATPPRPAPAAGGFFLGGAPWRQTICEFSPSANGSACYACRARPAAGCCAHLAPANRQAQHAALRHPPRRRAGAPRSCGGMQSMMATPDGTARRARVSSRGVGSPLSMAGRGRRPDGLGALMMVAHAYDDALDDPTRARRHIGGPLRPGSRNGPA
jgi:hypothetical protein